MEHLNIFNNIITIISFIVNMAFLIPFTMKIYDYFTNKKFAKRVLGFNNESVQLSHSTFDLITESGSKNNFITYASLESINNIINLLNIIGQDFDLVNEMMNAKNEINIGGFLTNKKVNAYFTKYFNNFKFITDTKYKKIYDKYPIDKRMIEYSSEKTGFKINDDIFLETNREITDYAFLIKLTNNDFKNDNIKAVHILFGGGDIGTIKSTEYLLTHYKQIYNKFKNNHYFFAMEVNRIDGSINYSRGIINLTDIMFQNNN